MAIKFPKTYAILSHTNRFATPRLVGRTSYSATTAYPIVLLGMLSSDSPSASSATETFSISETDFAKKLNELHGLFNQLRAKGYVFLSFPCACRSINDRILSQCSDRPRPSPYRRDWQPKRRQVKLGRGSHRGECHQWHRTQRSHLSVCVPD